MYPEPWHLSYWPIADVALGEFTIDMVREALEGAEMLGKEIVLAQLPTMILTHVQNISNPESTETHKPTAHRSPNSE